MNVGVSTTRMNGNCVTYMYYSTENKNNGHLSSFYNLKGVCSPIGDNGDRCF